MKIAFSNTNTKDSQRVNNYLDLIVALWLQILIILPKRLRYQS